MRVRFRPRAEQDVETAARLYETRLTGLGRRFTNEVERSLVSIAQRPRAYPAVYRETRRALVATFPLAIHDIVRDDTVIIVAVLHAGLACRSGR